MHSIEIYYNAAFIISVLFSCIYVYLWHKHFSVNFSLMFAFIPIVNMGYAMLTYATSLEAALLATKVIYLGGCFLILFITFYIFDMCEIILPKWLITLMIGISSLLYFSVLTIGRSKLFYKNVTAGEGYNYISLHKEYGPIHTVFYIVIIIYFLVGFAAIIYTMLKKQQVSRRIIRLLFIPEVISFLSFFLGKIITKEFEFLPASYVTAQIMYLIIAHYICSYNITDTAIDSLIETGSTGFVSFDFNLNYLGSNKTARNIIPEINKLTVDRPLSRSDKLWKKIVPWINAFKADESKDKYYYNIGESIYLVDINYLFHSGRKRGYQLVITDDTKNQKYIELIDNYNYKLESEVKEKTEDIVKMHTNLIRSMAKLVESRDNSTGGHIIRTSDVVEILMDEIMKDKKFSKRYKIDDEFRSDIIKAAPLHDIGKIAIDDEILRKPGRFTDEEFEIMKTHSAEGAKVLHSILKDTDDESFKVLAENVAHYHHERMDGSGYPEGLEGDNIPMEARIMAIADVYDALVSKRVYKEKMPFDKANEIMLDSMGKHFDLKLKKFYVAALPRIEEYYADKE
ncbi:MAG: HD domain-containing protein [Lachnospiraceae bacterium]|nr:HD domain-containing protein [Lachnospiraceae bacterium]